MRMDDEALAVPDGELVPYGEAVKVAIGRTIEGETEIEAAD